MLGQCQYWIGCRLLPVGPAHAFTLRPAPPSSPSACCLLPCPCPPPKQYLPERCFQDPAAAEWAAEGPLGELAYELGELEAAEDDQEEEQDEEDEELQGGGGGGAARDGSAWPGARVPPLTVDELSAHLLAPLRELHAGSGSGSDGDGGDKRKAKAAAGGRQRS